MIKGKKSVLPRFGKERIKCLKRVSLLKETLKANTWYTMTLEWNGSQARNAKCSLLLNGKRAGSLKIKNTSPNGISYVHMISTAQTVDTGIYVQKVEALVK